MGEALVRTIHLIGVLGTGLSVLLLVLASRPLISGDDLVGVRRVYLALLIALGVTALAGVALWLWVGKPAAFFSNNPVFHAKLSLFALVILMLAWPAWYFSRLSADQPADETPLPNLSNLSNLSNSPNLSNLPVSALVRRLQKATLPLLLLIPILAYLMARGIGYT